MLIRILILALGRRGLNQAMEREAMMNTEMHPSPNSTWVRLEAYKECHLAGIKSQLMVSDCKNLDNRTLILQESRSCIQTTTLDFSSTESKLKLRATSKNRATASLYADVITQPPPSISHINRPSTLTQSRQLPYLSSFQVTHHFHQCKVQAGLVLDNTHNLRIGNVQTLIMIKCVHEKKMS
ncbi:hypothetical protein Tco_0653692 [Tanacetum coccineum]|uniref:Uncharacterized protein n=1 Tax=Tanacetum coccineum TaxID=301880 RepID=A0ABQ4X1F7_9ASTR